MARDCRAKSAESPKKDFSTGLLPTPTGGRGLSLSPRTTGRTVESAKRAAEEAWAVTVRDRPQGLEGLNELLWVVDSGAFRLMTFCKNAFTEYWPLEESIIVSTATGAEIQAIGTGSVVLKVPRWGIVRAITLTGVLYVPALMGSLLSVA